MELLLLQDIKGIGKKNDLVVVGDGFALNCLLPQRTALVATPVVRKRYAEHIKRRAQEREMEKSAAASAVSAVTGKSVRFAKKATKTGKLYAALTPEMIATAIKEQLALDLPASAVLVDEPIKALGQHQIQVQIGSNLANLTVSVEAEKAA